MRIDPDSRALNGLSTFLAFVALNVVYIVCCLPVVTIGAATAALFEVTIRFAEEESGRPLKDFFPAFARNFGRGTAVAACLLIPAALLIFSGLFWLLAESVLATVAGAIALLAAAFLFAVFLYAMALVAWFDTPVRRTLKNALLLPGAEPVRTTALVLIPATVVALTIAFPAFGLIVLTIGFSVGAYGAAFLFRSVFARQQNPT